MKRRLQFPGLALLLLAPLFLFEASGQRAAETATPIRHLVVIFPENISFDHYFGTYPVAANPPGEPAFTAAPDTPKVNGLNASLLTRNPNSLNPDNGPGAINPFRLDRSQASTASQVHSSPARTNGVSRRSDGSFPKSVGRGNKSDAAPASPLETTA